MSTTTNIDSLKINVLTKEQYNGATKDINQIYLVTDDGYDAVTTSTNGLMIASDKAKLDGIESGANKITVDNALSSTSTNPVQNKIVNSAIANLSELVGDSSVSSQITNAISDKVDTVTTSGSGNAITAISKSGTTITATKDSTFLTAHPTIATSTDSTSTASPAHGETFTAVDSITRDSNGHVTKINTKTVTLPTIDSSDTKVTNTLATTTKAYVTGTTSSTTNTGTQVFDTGVYLDTTAGQLTASKFKGALTGNADTATRLATARTIRTNLASTSTASFNGSANITPGVTGTLPVANGGTGGSTATAAVSNLGLDNAKTVGDSSADYVIEQGSSGIWTYRKWNSGIIECWGRNTLSVTINVANGNIYTTSNYTLSLPSGKFSSLIHYEMSVGNMTCWIAGITAGASKLTYRIASGSSTSGNMTITAYVMGT